MQFHYFHEKVNNGGAVNHSDFDSNQQINRSNTALVVTKNAVANLARPLSAWILVLVLPPLLVRSLGKDSYAIWVLILQVGAYISLIDGAIQSAVARYVAHALSRNDRRAISQMVSSALLLLVIVAAVCFVAVLVTSFFLPLVMKAASLELVHQAKEVLLIVGFAYVINLPFAAFGGIFAGFQKNTVIAVATTVSKFVSAVGIATAAVLSMGLVWMAIFSVPGILIQPFIYLAAIRRLPFVPELSTRLLSREMTRLFFSFSAAIMLTQFMSLLISGLDMPIVAYFDFSHTAYYAVAATASNALLIPFSSILGPVMPVASGLHAVGSSKEMGALLNQVTRLSTCLLCLLGAALLMSIYPLLTWWLNPDYAKNAAVFAQILIGAQFVRLTLMPYSLVALGAGQQKETLVSPLGEGLVNLICSLVGAYKFGAVGVAYGTLMGAFVGVILHFLISMKKTTAISVSRRQLVREILKPIAVTIFAITFFYLSGFYLHSGVLAMVLVLADTSLAAALMWGLVITSGDRSKIVELFTSIVKRVRPAT